MCRVAMWLALLLAGLAAGRVHAVLPPHVIEAEKQSADYRITVQLESVERIRPGINGGLDKARAEGRVVAVTRAPADAEAHNVQPGERIAFEVAAWPWDTDAEEPPGPERLYWGPGAPLPLLEVWGVVRDAKFIARVFEQTAAAPGSVAPDSITAVLERIDWIAAAVSTTPVEELPAAIENLTGLRFEASRDAAAAEHGWRRLQAAGDGWAHGAELRDTAAGPLVVLALGDVPCVRSSDVIARHGAAEGRPIPAPPEQALPSTWRLAYQNPWGGITFFGFRFAHANDFDNCLIEVIVRRDNDPSARNDP